MTGQSPERLERASGAAALGRAGAAHIIHTYTIPDPFLSGQYLTGMEYDAKHIFPRCIFFFFFFTIKALNGKVIS